MDDAISIDNRGDFGQWAIEVAKLIVGEQGFELARAARDGSEDDVRAAGNVLGQTSSRLVRFTYSAVRSIQAHLQCGGASSNSR